MTAPSFALVLIAPNGFIHVEAFRELIESLQCGFAALGRTVTLLINQLPPPGVVPIVFGAHHLAASEIDRLPANSILFNAEQLVADNPVISADYHALLHRFEVWDFSPLNLETLLAGDPGARCRLLPLDPSPTMARLQPAAEDIDILFYGVRTPRRIAVLDALSSSGLNVVALLGVYGAERDDLIARARLILNLHGSDSGRFESSRVVPLLVNGKAVVTEEAEDIPQGLRDGLRIVPYAALVDACRDLLTDEVQRRHLQQRAHRIASACLARQAQPLAAVLGLPPPVQAPLTGLPAVLLAGAGKRQTDLLLRADANDRYAPDWQVDFGQPLEFGRETDFGRHGNHPLREEMFDAIIAHHLLEHIPDLVTAMTNFLRLLRPGGVMHVEVPYDLSYGAWQDPTHVRAFNERSWLYFTDWHDHVDWQDARFDVLHTEFILSPLGQKLRKDGVNEANLLVSPRAVDSMRLRLAKRSLRSTNSHSGFS